MRKSFFLIMILAVLLIRCIPLLRGCESFSPLKDGFYYAYVDYQNVFDSLEQSPYKYPVYLEGCNSSCEDGEFSEYHCHALMMITEDGKAVDLNSHLLDPSFNIVSPGVEVEIPSGIEDFFFYITLTDEKVPADKIAPSYSKYIKRIPVYAEDE